VGGADEDAGGVQVAQQLGYLSQGDVEGAIERHARTLFRCYERAGEAQSYAQGDVVLRFMVLRTGQVRDVLVVSSELGNYAVERCLVVEGRAIPFPPPDGNQDTDFEYTLKFRASGERSVVNWDAEAMAKDLDAQAASLAACGPPGSDPVQAVAYVRPGGAVVSVGLSSEGALDIMNAMCVVEQIRKWRLPADGRHIVRTTFPIGPAIAMLKPAGGPPNGAGLRAQRGTKRGKRTVR
jgi:TonB family protein